MTSPIKTALLSFGMSGRVFHGPFLHINPGFEICKVWQRSKSDVHDMFPYVKIVRSMEEILSDPEIELVFVNTPDTLHYEHTAAVLAAGKHAVVEKPFTITSTEAQELVNMAESAGLILSVYQNRRWDSDFQTLKQVIAGEWVGRVVEFHSSYQRYRNFIQPNTWKEEPLPGAGIVYNLGSHLIDQALHLLGMPEEIFADIRTQRTGGRIPDHFQISLYYEGLKANLMAGYLVRELGPRFKLQGTEGTFVKYGMDPQEELLKQGILPRGTSWGAEPESDWGLMHTTIKGLNLKGKIESLKGDYGGYYQNIYEAIREGKPLAVPGSDGVRTIKVIEAAIRSFEEGKRIRL
ncbi:MAG: Gfo/Idh/MocA family oxidoreductase [Bacteroidia bacterium]|nr:Gfo/Idh/MocA family oxidoreductase [Bacteroidia bacterium]